LPLTDDHARTRPPSRALRLALPLAGLMILTACVEDECEKLTAHLSWSPDAGTVKVELVLENLPATALSCQDVPTCLQAAQVELSQGQNSFTGRLATGGARELSARFQTRGDELDLVVDYTADVGSEAAVRDYIYVSTTGKPHLVILQTPGVTVLSPKAREVERVQRPGEEGPETFIVHRLPAREREAAIERSTGKTVTPLFQTVPGLREALTQEGLLVPEAEARSTP
jgi:hypothetical protein